MSTEAKSFFQLANQIRQSYPKISIIAGGPHPTHFPQIIDTWQINAVVMGEGDLIIGKIMENLKAGKDFSDISNVHTKNQKNALPPLISNLDDILYPDRDLLHHKLPLSYVRMNSFMATRGCPYHCAYCFNSAYKKLYNGFKTYRRRSVENVIQEIEQVKNKYGLDFVRFGDDVFVSKYDEWVEEFVAAYQKRIGIPFYFATNPNLVTKELISVLKKAGCYSMGMAIESSNESLRQTVLNRKVTDSALVNAYTIVNEFDIKTFANSMLGLPGTTLEDDLRTVEMAFQLKPTYASFTVFTPFPGTELYHICEEQGLLPKALSYDDNDFPDSTFQVSILKHVSQERKQVQQNILMLAALANWMPFLKTVIVQRLFYWKPNKTFWLIGFLIRNYLQMKIWTFRVNLKTFSALVYKVFRIDSDNYKDGQS